MDAIRSTAATATAAATSVFSFPAFVYTEIRGAISDWLRPPSPNVHVKLEIGARFSSDVSERTGFHMKGGEIARLTFSRSSYDGKCNDATVTYKLSVLENPAGANFHITASGNLGEQMGEIDAYTTNSKGETIEDKDGPFDFAEVETYTVTTHSNVLDLGDRSRASLESFDCGSGTEASEPM